GNKDKQTLTFDPEIEKTLRKLRKQAKFQEHSHEIPFEELLKKNLRTKLVITLLVDTHVIFNTQEG
ncbi:hypothetical protein PIB30_103096, partial [Stylosanthes scabra]|nr:hypothetical protein [Stylosanthes scabra]